jgi:glycosyltransferase involved in cell wall biosynthesis
MKTTVHLCVWSGDAARARELAGAQYPGAQISEFSHRRLRVSGLMQRIRLLRSLAGQAAIFYFDSLRGFQHRQILQCFQLLHRCQETSLCDKSGHWESFQTVDVFRSAPGALMSILRDARSVIFWWCYLQLSLKRTAPVDHISSGEPEVAYLIPNPASMGAAGGAISHIRGFLHGLKTIGITCRVFSGTALAQDAFQNEIIPAKSRPHFLSGAVLLSYNFVFVRGVQRYLARSRPRFLYQRHCAFSIAGAVLSRRLSVPLILEYNGSEEWMANHWDPNPLRSWIRLCEEITLRSAARIMVVSKVLRDDLVQRGISPDRIRVNPNAVDPDYFYPGRGRETGRNELGVGPEDVLIGFVGSFSLWHGIEMLQQAIATLLNDAQPCRLRFVLIGDGLLHGEMRSALAAYEKTQEVIFTGPLPRDKVAEYLDASDILVSPHIPMPDGSRFFGSPTKIFELAEAILHLALDPEKRAALGGAARRAAVERHCWSANVAHALSNSDGLERRVS